MIPVQLKDCIRVIRFFDPASPISIKYSLLYFIHIVCFFNQCFTFLMKFLTVFHSCHYCFSYQLTSFICRILLPSFIHSKYLHFVFFGFFMGFSLHVQPHSVHFFKQNGDFFCSLCLICIHFFYCVCFFFGYFFSQFLYHFPYTAMTDRLPTGVCYDLSCASVWCFRYCLQDLFC